MARAAPRGPVLFVAIATLLATLAAAQPAPDVAPCPGYTIVPHQGPSCPVPGGWRVHLRDGTDLFTHGPDGAALDEVPAVLAPRAPRCVAATDHHGRVIYAVPSDKANRWATMAATIRGYVHAANGVLYQEAQEFGQEADYKFRCLGTQVEVVNETLPTPSGSDSFSTIVSDLRAKGYMDTRAKYWVWYDDGVGGYCGQGSIRGDDRLILENNNNRGNDFGITYGCGSNVMQHENGHNLGAVQLSAPDSSGAWHCFDGQDVMCYADGGGNGTYNPNVCTDRRHFDCGHDSYFHPDPPPGSYLATHWNLGSRLVRFISWGCDTDRTPPTTTHALGGQQGPVPGHFRSDVEVTLSAADACSTPVTEHRVDGGAWGPYTAPFPVSGEGSHVVEYRSRDAAGNQEPVRNATFRIDLTPPTLDNLLPDQSVYLPDGAILCCPLPDGHAIGGARRAILVQTRVQDDVLAYGATAAARPAPLDLEPAPWADQCASLVDAAGIAGCVWDRETWELAAPQLRVTAQDGAGNTASLVLQVVT